MKQLKRILNDIYIKRDKRWIAYWVVGLCAVWVWDVLFLNAPALRQIEAAMACTFVVSFLVVIFSLLTAWTLTLILHFTEYSGYRWLYLILTFLINVLRSVPQIIGVLLGYAVLTFLIEREVLESDFWKIVCMACIIGVFVFLELLDLLRERIRFFQQSDFYPAMLVSGVRELRIVQYEILWKNCVSHILNKLIAIFGISIFLQCSVDFIISVGLSTDVSSLNFPATLGSMLAKMDSKKDILAIGNSMMHPGYLPHLFFTHLQGITIAFLIVFTLFTIYKANKEFARRYRL